MAKTDFSKAEDAFSDSLRQFNIEKLLSLTSKQAKEEAELERAKVAASLKQELLRLFNQVPHVEKKLGFSKEQIQEMLKSKKNYSDSEWEVIQELKKKVRSLLKEAAKKKPSKTDETLIAEARKKHLNKRFNVNDKWLPLH